MMTIGLSALMLFAFFAAPALANNEAATVALADRRFNHALEQADIPTLQAMIVRGYVFTDPSGRVAGRDEIIGGLATGRIRVTSQTTRNVRIKVFGDAAVETGLLISVAVRDGHNSGGTYRFTRVWVKQGGRWRTAAIQETAPQVVETQ